MVESSSSFRRSTETSNGETLNRHFEQPLLLGIDDAR